MLPQVRREANDWRASSAYYLAGRDSARAADTYHVAALGAALGRYDLQGVLLASREADVAIWKQRARRRGLVAWLLAAGAAAVGYLAITH